MTEKLKGTAQENFLDLDINCTMGSIFLYTKLVQ